MYESMNDERKRELCKLLASNLATLRTKANLKQHELADKLGLSRQTISVIENGKRIMEWSTFTAIALLFLRNREIKELMVVMGIIDSSVDELLNIEKKGC